MFTSCTLSCEEALREAMSGAQRGVHVWVETLIQYLLLDRTDAEKPNFEGAKNVMSPPLRDKRTRECFGTVCGALYFDARDRSRALRFAKRKSEWAKMTSRGSQTAFRRWRTG
jgi:hypothetical protein